ncbi:MAG: hypothetical protein HOP18_21070 [Deltaproteobacteria bacterium]|nr:hypothetical protein [Deltaproteobacteria bacterium]
MLGVLFLFLCCFPATVTAQINPEPPPLVRFTGSLLPLDHPKPAGLSTLTVSIKEKKWRLHLTKVEKLSGHDHSGTRLLQSIFPPHLRLTGPAPLLDLLRDPAVEGKPLTIEGHLYVGDRMFFVTIVNTPPQE